MRDGHDHLLVRDQVLDGELAFVASDLAATLVAVLGGDLRELGLEQFHPTRARAEQVLHVLDEGLHFRQLFFQLLDLEAGELGEAHVEDGFRLPIAQQEPRLQLRVGGGRIRRAANDPDHFVDVVDGDLQPFQDVLAFQRLVQLELRAPHDHFVAMGHVVLEHFPERHDLRHEPSRDRIGHQREHDDAERGLQLGVLVELVQDDARNGIALQFDHHAEAVAIAFVPQIADAFELLVTH